MQHSHHILGKSETFFLKVVRRSTCSSSSNRSALLLTPSLFNVDLQLLFPSWTLDRILSFTKPECDALRQVVKVTVTYKIRLLKHLASMWIALCLTESKRIYLGYIYSLLTNWDHLAFVVIRTDVNMAVRNFIFWSDWLVVGTYYIVVSIRCRRTRVIPTKRGR